MAFEYKVDNPEKFIKGDRRLAIFGGIFISSLLILILYRFKVHHFVFLAVYFILLVWFNYWFIGGIWKSAPFKPVYYKIDLGNNTLEIRCYGGKEEIVQLNDYYFIDSRGHERMGGVGLRHKTNKKAGYRISDELGIDNYEYLTAKLRRACLPIPKNYLKTR